MSFSCSFLPTVCENFYKLYGDLIKYSKWSWLIFFHLLSACSFSKLILTVFEMPLSVFIAVSHFCSFYITWNFPWITVIQLCGKQLIMAPQLIFCVERLIHFISIKRDHINVRRLEVETCFQMFSRSWESEHFRVSWEIKALCSWAIFVLTIVLPVE